MLDISKCFNEVDYIFLECKTYFAEIILLLVSAFYSFPVIQKPPSTKCQDLKGLDYNLGPTTTPRAKISTSLLTAVKHLDCPCDSLLLLLKSFLAPKEPPPPEKAKNSSFVHFKYRDVTPGDLNPVELKSLHVRCQSESRPGEDDLFSR